MSTAVLTPGAAPLRKSARRLRWFRASFRDEVRRVGRATGVEFAVDERALARAFVEWLRAFDAQKPADEEAKRAYVGFAAGLMLRALVRNAPLRVVQKPQGADGHPAYIWPEGYAYVAYCLNVRTAVLTQDFVSVVAAEPRMDEVETWWSFKENVAENPSLGIAFLDYFAGEEPRWTMPDVFRAPDLPQIAERFYDRRTLSTPSGPESGT